MAQDLFLASQCPLAALEVWLPVCVFVLFLLIYCMSAWLSFFIFVFLSVYFKSCSFIFQVFVSYLAEKCTSTRYIFLKSYRIEHISVNHNCFLKVLYVFAEKIIETLPTLPDA